MPELKSSCDKGLEAELIAQEDILKRKCKILHTRLKTPFAEVDILAENTKGQLVIIEVKTLSQWDFLSSRISKAQIKRLKRAAIYLAAQHKKEIILCAAFVIQKRVYYMSLSYI